MSEGTEIELIDIDLDWHASGSPSAGPSAATDSGARRRPRFRFDPRWLIAAAVVVYLGWLVTSSGDDEAEEPAAPATPTASVAPDETVTIDDDQLALVGDPSLDMAASIATMTTEDFRTAYLEMQVNPGGTDVFAVIQALDTVPAGYRFAFLAADGRPVVINTDDGSVVSVVNERPMAADSGFAVLADAAGVIGLAPDEPDTLIRVADDLSVVRRASGELMAVRETPTGVEYGPPEDPAAWGTLPLGSEFWVEPGVGVLLTPNSGGVFEITETGVEMVTPHELISTNGDRWVERRRLPGPDEYWVVAPDGDEWLIDREQFDTSGDLAISPDGAWIYVSGGLVGSPLPAFYGIETGQVMEVESRADRLPPVWAPDSSFVALLDARRSCIWLNFVHGENGCILLDKLKVEALAAASLVVY